MTPTELENTLPHTLQRDIRSAVADLESIRTSRNRDKIVWAQVILTACADLAETFFPDTAEALARQAQD